MRSERFRVKMQGQDIIRYFRSTLIPSQHDAHGIF